MAHRLRQRYVEAACSELNVLTRRLERLRSVVERGRGDRRLQHERHLDDLRGLANRATAKVEDVRRASEDAWKSFKVHADSAIAQFRDKIEIFEAEFAELAA